MKIKMLILFGIVFCAGILLYKWSAPDSFRVVLCKNFWGSGWQSTDNQSKEITHKIYTILEKHRIKYDLDQCSVDPKSDKSPKSVTRVDEFIEHINYFVKNNNPIPFLLVGFPFKSGNTEKKVIGCLPDMAERKSLEYFNNTINEIGKIYKPSGFIEIFCDGAFFAQFFDISDKAVLDFEANLKQLAQDLPNIRFFTTKDLIKKFCGDKSLKAYSIKDLIKWSDDFKPTDEEFKKSMQNLPDVALKRFALELDCEKGKQILKKMSLEEVVFNLLKHQERLRNFLSEIFSTNGVFGDRIRLTVHFSSDLAKKFGIQYSPNSCVLPYHGVLVEDSNGDWYIKFKKDVDLTKYQLTSKNINGVKCYYFVEVGLHDNAKQN